MEFNIDNIISSLPKKTNERKKNVIMPKNESNLLNSILHTGAIYNKIDQQTYNNSFSNQNNIDEYIERDINNLRYNNWNQIPITYKIILIKEYIEDYNNHDLYKIAKSKCVKYNKKNGCIMNIDFDKL